MRIPDSAGKLVVLEGVYSMLDDVAPLAEVVRVAKANGAMVLVDVRVDASGQSCQIIGRIPRFLQPLANIEKQENGAQKRIGRWGPKSDGFLRFPVSASGPLVPCFCTVCKGSGGNMSPPSGPAWTETSEAAAEGYIEGYVTGWGSFATSR